MGYTVRSEAKDLELSRVGSGINLHVYYGRRKLGRLKIGKGGIQWYPRGSARPRPSLNWKEFASKIES